MVRPLRLILIGYWDGPDADHSWPAPEGFVDSCWDETERDLVASFLRRGFVARAFMGYSECRMCGKKNGDLELSDGLFVWPEGLAHYVAKHEVRPPERFVRHVIETVEALETAERDEQWWRTVGPASGT